MEQILAMVKTVGNPSASAVEQKTSFESSTTGSCDLRAEVKAEVQGESSAETNDTHQ